MKQEMVSHQDESKNKECIIQNSLVKKKSQRKKSNGKLIVGAIAITATIIGIGYGASNYKPTIKLADYTTVEVDGYDGLGKATATIDWDSIKAKYGDKIKYTREVEKYKNLPTDEVRSYTARDLAKTFITCETDKEENLSNGDAVKVSYQNVTNIQSLLTCEFDTTPLDYTVSGLETVDTFDAFANVKVEFSGASGSGNVKYEYDGDEVLYLVCDKENGTISNGDKVRISIEMDDADAFIKKYGHLPEKMEKTYEVSGLTEYCSTIDEIPQTAKDEMMSYADVEIAKYISNQNDDYMGYLKMRDATYVGDYMLKRRDDASTASTNFNEYVMVYSVKYYDDSTAYFGIEFDNISATSDGNYVVENISSPDMVGYEMFPSSYVNTLDDFKVKKVDDKLKSYYLEWNVN